MVLFQDMPIEILKIIFKKLDPISVKNCSITCHRWKEIVAHYIFQPYLQKLASDEDLKLSLKQKLSLKGWTHECVDYDLIIALYEELKFFKGMDMLLNFGIGADSSTFRLPRFATPYYQMGFFKTGFAENFGLYPCVCPSS